MRDLEALRLGAGLDNGPRLRRGDMSDWKYIYVEDGKENFTDIASRESLPFIPDRAGSGPERWTYEETRCGMGNGLQFTSLDNIQIVQGFI